MWRRAAQVLLILALTGPVLLGQCGTPGTGGLVPRLDISTDLWDSIGDISLSQGLPGAHWLIASDLVPGPVATPFGTLCLGVSPSFYVLLDSLGGISPVLDAGGSFVLTASFPPQLSFVLGVPVHLQAAVFDPQGQAGLALSNDHLFQLKAPKLAIASVAVPPRTIDIFDAFALTSTPSTALLASIPNQAFEDIAFSPDGRVVYSRDVLLTTPNRVRAFDITTIPATLLAEATVGTASGGAARRGVVIDRSGAVGYFCDTAGVQRFDADPGSPTFMSITGFALTTLQPPDSLAVSPDGQRLFVVGASISAAQPSIMAVIDTISMTEIATVPLTDVGSVLGMTQRGPVVVSASGEFVATVSLGFHLPGLGPLSSAVLSIVHTSPGPTQYTEVAAVTLPRAFQDDLAFDPRDPTESTLYTVDSDQSNGDVYLTTVDWVGPTISDTYLTTGSVGLKGEGGVGTTPNGSFIYVATSADDTLRVLDASSLVVMQSLLLTSSGLPNRLCVERR